MASEGLLREVLVQCIGPVVLVSLGAVATRFGSTKLQASATVRRELINDMVGTATSLYLETQYFWRERQGASPERCSMLRERLDQAYLDAQRDGERIEKQLATFFPSRSDKTGRPEVVSQWHAVRDLLTVRYFQLINRNTQSLRAANAGPRHSGLTESQLDNAKIVLDSYRARLDDAVRLVASKPGWGRTAVKQSALDALKTVKEVPEDTG